MRNSSAVHPLHLDNAEESKGKIIVCSKHEGTTMILDLYIKILQYDSSLRNFIHDQGHNLKQVQLFYQMETKQDISNHRISNQKRKLLVPICNPC
jgi:hypothetical protein